ncbi:DUF1686 domain-containing protein [Encephalitozoon cuniculi]|nr:DUF1686 domain-containing protein [Encephalitozoon cuniculi]
MEQAKSLRAMLTGVSEGIVSDNQLVKETKPFLDALLFYEESLNSFLGYYLNREIPGREECVAAVDAAKEALKILMDGIKALIPSYYTIEAESFFKIVDDLIKHSKESLQVFKNALREALPYANDDLKVQTKSTITGKTKNVLLKNIIFDLLEGGHLYNDCHNNVINNFLRRMNLSGVNVFRWYFNPTFPMLSFEPVRHNYLEAYKKAVHDLEENRGLFTVEFNKLKERLEEMVTEAENLQTRIKSLQPIDDGTPKDATPEVPKKDPSKAEGEDKEPLEEAPSPVRRAVASLDTGRPFGNLCLVFVLVLAVQGLLRVSGMEHSTLGVSWNTALYSLAVAGAVTYQLWVLAEGCRRGGAGSMARQGWSAVACMAPMLVAVPHAGVIRSSMYSVAVAGLAAVTLYVQDAARRGMPWREACAVGAGNAVLAAVCAAGSVAPADGVCGRPFWVWMGVVVFVSLLLAVSYAERGGRGQKAEECGDAVASVLLVTTVVVGTIGSLVCGRAYHEMYVGGGWKYLPSDEIE